MCASGPEHIRSEFGTRHLSFRGMLNPFRQPGRRLSGTALDLAQISIIERQPFGQPLEVPVFAEILSQSHLDLISRKLNDVKPLDRVSAACFTCSES